jgi:hypothetical protein
MIGCFFSSAFLLENFFHLLFSFWPTVGSGGIGGSGVGFLPDWEELQGPWRVLTLIGKLRISA